MIYAWDENKRLDNIHKHGIDFVGCDAIFDGYTVTAEDLRFDYDEQRFKTLGVFDGRLVSVIHTETDAAIRIISIRKATKHEQEIYFSKIDHGLGEG